MQRISTKTLAELPARYLKFAELLAKGNMSAAAAARECGFKNSTALKQSYRWIGKDRQGSQYPALYDYFHELRKEALRQYDISIDTITAELRTIAFSSIDRYLDLPSKAVHDKIEQLTGQLEKKQIELEKYYSPPPKGAPDGTPGSYAPQAKPIAEKILKIKKQIRKLESGPGYSLTLKYREDIPDELMPAVAEISQTEHGIRVKLHSKLDAIEKLAQWKKMYDSKGEGDEGGNAAAVKSIQIVVKGSKSDLLPPPTQDQAAA